MRQRVGVCSSFVPGNEPLPRALAAAKQRCSQHAGQSREIPMTANSSVAGYCPQPYRHTSLGPPDLVDDILAVLINLKSELLRRQGEPLGE